MNKNQLLESLKKQGFSEKIINAFSKVKRENFISKNLEERAYENIPLAIGKGATISQPYTIATMLNMLNLKLGQKVLEIGSGCGYVLALISEIIGNTGQVYGIEVIKDLAEKSKKNISNYKNIQIYNKNGRFGLKEKALFDRILISAGSKEISKELLFELKNNGILVAPIGSRHMQSLVAIKRNQNKFKIISSKSGFIFVELV